MGTTAHARTDVGCVRSNNEDDFLCDTALQLYAVCDGMGGHEAGEVASAMACAALRRHVGELAAAHHIGSRTLSTEVALALVAAMRAAMATISAQICAHGQSHSARAGLGTTCTALWHLGDNRALVAHIGDSRLYVHHAGSCQQLTQDHTLVAELVARGVLAERDAAAHPLGHVLARALGAPSALPADAFLLAVQPGDTFLLCSDGLHTYLHNDAGLAAPMGRPSLAEGAEALVARAKKLGGHDNVTAVLVRVDGGCALPWALLRGQPALAALPPDRLRQVAAWLTPLQLGAVPIAALGLVGIAQGHATLTHGPGASPQALAAGTWCAPRPLGPPGAQTLAAAPGPLEGAAGQDRSPAAALQLEPAALLHLTLTSPVLGAYLLGPLMGAASPTYGVSPAALEMG